MGRTRGEGISGPEVLAAFVIVVPVFEIFEQEAAVTVEVQHREGHRPARPGRRPRSHAGTTDPLEDWLYDLLAGTEDGRA